MDIITEYPFWWAIFCLAAGILISFILYYKEKKLDAVPSWLKGILAFLRGASIALLSFFLLGPLLQSVDKKVEQPIVVFAQDNSSSFIFNGDSAYYKTKYLIEIDKLKSDLDEKYDIGMYQFDGSISDNFNPDFAGDRTNMSQMIEEVYNRYSNRNIGAVILASDGIYNEGSNPLYASNKLKIPFYTIAGGDTTIRRDVILENVAHNRLAYLGNDFPMEITVKANKFKGKKTNVSVRNNGAVVYSQTVDITDDNFLTTIPATLSAASPGIQKFTVSIKSLEDELSVDNNYKTVYIEVLDNKQNVLLLADQVHPDIAAIRYSLENNSNYEVEVKLAHEFSGEIGDYSLIILHQLPSLKRSMADLLKEAREKLKPIFFIVGNETNLKNLNLLNAGVNIISKQTALNDAQVSINNDFTLFKVEDEIRELLPKFPPLQTPFGEITPANSAEILLKQKIGVVTTDYPLLLFNEVNGNKSAVLMGEGIWRWRLFDFLENDSHENFDAFVLKMVQYMAAKEDRSFFRVYNETKFDEGDNIYFEAELYNKAYELVNDPDVNVVITDEDGAEFPYSFSRRNGQYILNVNGLGPGEYSFSASADYNRNAYKRSGEFSITEVVVEQTNTTANHQLLYNLSESTGGKMYYPNQLKELTDEILNKKEIAPVSYSTKKLSDWINLKWIFFVLLVLLSTEWFIRKYKGAY
ncbi:MAG: hypothetical protein ACI8XB_000423 [Patiriisocius sp.]